MASNDPTHQAYRELAHRTNHGIEVVLFWRQISNELTVSVFDQRSGAHFELASEPDNALDVFNHPYAYAAFRGLPYAEVPLPSWAEAAATGTQDMPGGSEKPTR